jgi:hypothetical protein
MTTIIFLLMCIGAMSLVFMADRKYQPRNRKGQYTSFPKASKGKRQVPIKEGSTVIGYIYL